VAVETPGRQHEQPVAGTRAPRRRSVEGVIQVVIMLAIGAAAGAASFTHVHDVAAEHGQAGWLAWADAVVLELMSVASGLEIRRRKRLHAPVGFPVVVLSVAVSLSLSAQVVDAEASPIGWITAAIPALGFLVMVKIALAQAPAVSALTGVEVDLPEASAVQSPDGSGISATPDPPGAVRAVEAKDVEVLMPAARAAVEVLDRDGERVSRQALAGALRADGHAVSNALASALLRALKAEAAAAEGRLDPAAMRRRFGPSPRGPRPVSAARSTQAARVVTAPVGER
jgi:hypothetical protein